MNNYPELENSKNESSVGLSDNRKTIKDSYKAIKKQSNIIINNALKEKKKALNSQLNKIPSIYKGLRNNLTLSNNKAKKVMEEHIANTGNHTASGYAMSKRMNNLNEYNKEMSNINLSERSEINSVLDKIEEAKASAAAERAKVSAEYGYKELQDILNEEKRLADLAEEKRVNDSKIKKTESDIQIAEDKNKRDNEMHQIEMKYEPEVYQAKLDGMYKDNILTDAKIAKTKADTYKSYSSKSKSASTSKMSAKDIAENIIKQIGLKQYDHNGAEYYDYDKLDAMTWLLTWRNKFGLSEQVVNDAAIYLGIPDYI